MTGRDRGTEAGKPITVEVPAPVDRKAAPYRVTQGATKYGSDVLLLPARALTVGVAHGSRVFACLHHVSKFRLPLRLVTNLKLESEVLD